MIVGSWEDHKIGDVIVVFEETKGPRARAKVIRPATIQDWINYSRSQIDRFSIDKIEYHINRVLSETRKMYFYEVSVD